MAAPSLEALEKLSRKQISGSADVVEILDIDDVELPTLVRAQANVDTEGEIAEALRDTRDSYGDIIEACYAIYLKFASVGFGQGELAFS